MKRATSLALAMLLVASRASADDTASLQHLLDEAVVTTASKGAESATHAPALSRNISAEDLRRYGITSVDEALNFLGVGVRAQTALATSEITVRGAGFTGDAGNHVLVLVDDHVVNEPLYGSASTNQLLGVPLELIDHVEVVLGPGSAVHGSNAVLGVINVVTKSASTHDGMHAAVEAGSVGSLRTTVSTGQSFDLLGKRAGLTAGLSYYRRWADVDIAPVNLGMDPMGGVGRFTTNGPATGMWGGHHEGGDYVRVPSAHLRFTREGLDVMVRGVASHAAALDYGGDFDNLANGKRERRVSLSVRQRFALGHLAEGSLRLYGDAFHFEHRHVTSYRSKCPIAETCDHREYGHSDRLGAEYQTSFDWFRDGRLTTLLGSNVSLEHVSDQHQSTDLRTGKAVFAHRDITDVNDVLHLAAFGQQRVSPLSWLHLDAGGRVDWRKYFDDVHSLSFAPVLTPRLAVSVDTWRGGTAKAIYSEAFRMPNVVEVDGASQILLRSQGLKPERTHSAELVFEQRIRAQRLLFSAFRTGYDDIINRVTLTDAEVRRAIAEGRTVQTYNPTALLEQYRTSAEMRTSGFTMAYDGSAREGHLRLGGSFTGAVARSANGQLVPVAPQLFGNARVSYDLADVVASRWMPTLAAATTFTGRTVADRSYEGGFLPVTTVPPTLDARITLTGQVPRVHGLSYRLIATHAFHAEVPLGVGPLVRPIPGLAERPTLAPSARSSALVGLQYDF